LVADNKLATSPVCHSLASRAFAPFSLLFVGSGWRDNRATELNPQPS